ncbi:glutathione S-transferase [Rubellimicrobium rubrum]|uniref:Glutathione S-transferase n=1 Tax=Rubellimicrobium rubrum TaxID=2585369 RepID=A0A5C4MSC0_9RHOB|nr:glutathione S-transferase [Rubellimicrobium rubrum]TNC46984.1 glutathione S-transferase [Rubellimicrobium rubrum]
MKLLTSPASPFVRKVRVLIREAGREEAVEEIPVSTSALATDPQILSHNPLGRIPTLIRDDGPAMVDSRVICRFLDAQFKLGLYPEEHLWDVLTLEALADGMLDSAVSMAYEVRLRPEDKRFPDWIEAQWAKIARGLDSIEADWSSHLARLIDMGQLALACALGYLDFRHAARNWREGRPSLAAWDARMAQRPSLQATRPR